jgi:predicted ATPase/DNA-binding SARP family transcriptional activator
MERLWRIELLGRLRAVHAERVVTRFRSHKTGALLAYLAFHAGVSHPRDLLTELLWPEEPLDSARMRLRTALSSLRRQLEPPGVPAGAVLVTHRLSAGLNPAAVTTDVAWFEAALEEAAGLPSGTEKGERLTTAVELYRGPLLPGYFEAWVLPQQQRLLGRFIQAVRQLIGSLEQAGELARAIDYAARAVAADPLCEESHHELIRLYVAAGQPTAALRQYQDLERRLGEELGETPNEATRQLLRAVERGDPTRGSEEARGRGSDRTSEVAPSPPRPVAPSPVPTGTVTFLLADIEGSTAQWQRAGDAFRTALASHHAVLRDVFQRHSGHEVQEAGDSFLVAFGAAGEALAAAIAGQKALAAHSWPDEVGHVKVRMALHTGDVELESGQYRGLVLHHAARMLAAAHGGQILCSTATMELLRRGILEPGVQLEDLGVYRLRDLTSPERLFQVTYPEMPCREFPPLRAEAGSASHLPQQFTRFFGREREVQELQGWLRSGEVRLATLTGPGGSGKTRLAIETAETLVNERQGSVWFVPLADLSEPGLIADTVRDAMRLPRSPQVPPLDQIVELLSRQPSLLVLDNFEQLVAGGAVVVRELLERVPELHCLVTSRQLLDLAGEREFRVDPLPTPPLDGEGGLRPEQLTVYESVRLFVDRAQAVRPDFQVTNSNAPAVAELCHRLEGIPLAIELAAARAKLLTPAQMLNQLARRFDFLVSRRRDLPGRHQTLRAAIDWSYQLLPPELQHFLARLFVFRGGFSLEAAEAVCQASGQALDCLAQLQDSSLILAESAGEEMRYRLLETLREYAAEQLSVEDRAAVACRHAGHYLALAEAVRAEGGTGLAGRGSLVRLETEHSNLRTALDWLVERAQEGDSQAGERALRLGGLLWRFWSSRGYWGEGRERLAALLTLPMAAGRTAARAEALAGLGNLVELMDGVTAAQPFYEESLAICRELGDKRAIADALHRLSHVFAITDIYDRQIALIEEARAIWEELGDRAGLASVRDSFGGVAYRRGDYATARAIWEETLVIQRELGDPSRIANRLWNIALVAGIQGDDATALPMLEEGLAIARELGDKRQMALCLFHLMRAKNNLGDTEGSLQSGWECLALNRDLQGKDGLAICLRLLGDVLVRSGELPTAQVLLEECLAIGHERQMEDLIADTRVSLGALALVRGDRLRARDCFRESLTVARTRFGTPPRFNTHRWRVAIARCLEGLAALAADAEGSLAAARLLGAAAACREGVTRGSPPADRSQRDRQLTRVRALAGEADFEAAWAEGRALSPEQAILLGLETAHDT